MSFVEKEKSTKRNFDKEAKLQIKILEQKSREDYLTYFSESENSTTSNFGNVLHCKRCSETDTKTCIPSNAKAILEKWMYEHRLYCYPTKEEKGALSLQTGLSLQKISNWFINSRRRILPKLLETEGKSAQNFTISRKNKKLDVATTSMVSCFAAFNDDATSFADYANQEEEKINDQSSIFNIDITPSSPSCDSVSHGIVVSHVEPYVESLKSSYAAMAKEIQQEEEKQQQRSKSNNSPAAMEAQQALEPQSLPPSSTFVSRGILYDKATDSKCIYIIINSPS